MSTLKTYTVTISGTEREDGEKPYTWAVSARNEQEAENKALVIHMDQAMCVDFDDSAEIVEAFEHLEIEETFEGLPDANCGYHWNDERGSK